MTTKTVTKMTIRNEKQPGGDIPEVVMEYIAAHPEVFQQYLTHDKDTERFIRMSRAGLDQSDAEAMAWLVWRARMVLGWSSENRKPTRTWAQAVESAWLKDELFSMCSDKRKAFYAEQEARRDRLETVKLCLTGSNGVKLADDVERSTKREKKAARAALKAEKAAQEALSTNNPANATDPLPPVEERLKEQSA